MLNKAITHGREWRKPYKGAKSVSRSCCNNGGCPYCEGNRNHKNRKRLVAALERERAARLGGSWCVLTVRRILPIPFSLIPLSLWQDSCYYSIYRI